MIEAGGMKGENAEYVRTFFPRNSNGFHVAATFETTMSIFLLFIH